MRIVIAEDEMLERKAMRKFIDQHFFDMTVVGEAINGSKAIEMARTTRPDIIIMDIRMPGINGLEAIEQIYAVQPSIKFVLISAYDSFDYAKKAMQFGIKDYILKPGKKEETVKALLRVKQEIEAERLEKNEKQRSEQFMKEQFLTMVTHIGVSEETAELQEKVFPHMTAGCFFVIWHPADSDPQAIKTFIEDVLDVTTIVTVNNQLVIVCLIANTPLQTGDLMTTAKDLQIQLGHTSYIGIGSPRFDLKNLPSSYHDAYAACYQLKLADKRPYGFLQKEIQQEEPTTIIAQICDQIEKGNANDAISHFQANQSVFRYTDYEMLYINVRDLFASRNIPFVNTSLTSLEKNQDWYAFFRLCAMTINDMYESRQLFSQAKSYIMAHYHESITLEDAAHNVHLTPNYFSSLFKQESGQTFTAFLTQVRLTQAKRLIEDNAYSLKEISYMVGYSNPNYFSRVFKKQYGKSPRHFHNEILKK